MMFEEKAEVVISQLRADRDRLQNTIKQIRAEIMSKDGLEEALEIIDKYREETEDEIILTKKEYGELVASEFDNGYAKGYREALEQPYEDCISRAQALKEADQLILETGYDNEKVEEMLKELPPVTPQPMKEKWQKLKETIIEMRDNNGKSTQQETCKFLANLMDVLEKQMEEKDSKEELCR